MIFHSPPQTFYKNIILVTATAVHAYFDFIFFQFAGKITAGWNLRDVS